MPPAGKLAPVAWSPPPPALSWAHMTPGFCSAGEGGRRRREKRGKGGGGGGGGAGQGGGGGGG